jgi:hypothetical protein
MGICFLGVVYTQEQRRSRRSFVLEGPLSFMKNWEIIYHYHTDFRAGWEQPYPELGCSGYLSCFCVNVQISPKIGCKGLHIEMTVAA